MPLRLLVILLVTALPMAACGDAGSPEPPQTDPAPAAPTTAPPAAPTTAPPAAPATAPPAAPVTSTTATATGGGGQVAEDGDTVAVHYRGTLDDGSEFDSSEGRDPLTFVVGSGQVISGFDAAVRGLAVGESRTVRMEPEDAYGEVDPALILEFPIGDAPEGVEVGDPLTLNTGQRVEVVEITDEVIRVDANHPLAGEALTFEVELVSIGS